MDDQKTKFSRLRFALASLSKRRKVAAVVLLFLMGVGISDQALLDEGDVSVASDKSMEGTADLDSITDLLNVFNEDTTTADAASVDESWRADSGGDATAPANDNVAGDNVLTIPPVTNNADELSFRNVSYHDKTQADSSSTESVAPSQVQQPPQFVSRNDDRSEILVIPAGSRPPASQKAVPSIRLTGTIYPVQ